MKTVFANDLCKAKNLGKTIVKRLNEIGVFTLTDLAEMTPSVAYQKISKQNPDKTMPVCYYLYSLQGALMNVHWDNLPKNMKENMKKEVEKNRVE